MKNRIFIILIIIFTSCSVLQKKPIELEGSFYKACDIGSYRVLTFDGKRFTEEKQRPHLDNPVYYGKGYYELIENTLILNYEPSETENVNIEILQIDTFLQEIQLIHLYFEDYNTKKPLNRVEIHVYSADGEYILDDKTNKEGIIKLTLPSEPERDAYVISAQYPFYRHLNINTGESGLDHIKYKISWKAGTQERRTSGMEKLFLENYTDRYLNIITESGNICPYLREDAYNYWLNEELMLQKKKERGYDWDWE